MINVALNFETMVTSANLGISGPKIIKLRFESGFQLYFMILGPGLTRVLMMPSKSRDLKIVIFAC
jgi:hypothetical protein